MERRCLGQRLDEIVEVQRDVIRDNCRLNMKALVDGHTCLTPRRTAGVNTRQPSAASGTRSLVLPMVRILLWHSHREE